MKPPTTVFVAAATLLGSSTILAAGCTIHTTTRASTSASARTSSDASVQTAAPDASSTPPAQRSRSAARGQAGGTQGGHAQPTVSNGVVVVETTCAGGERCNGLDDDCDGIIDEGCGYSSGAIQITLGWATGADLDLYVIDPMGETLSYRERASRSGGRLDQDARGLCNPNQAATTENVFWPGRQAPPGEYRVEVAYWGECNSGAGPTVANLSIAVGGRVIGAYNVRLQPNERRPIASFVVR